MGEGPMTGLKRGNCADSTTTGFGMGRGSGRGFGFSRGRGFGWRWQDESNKATEEASLESTIEVLKNQLKNFEGLLQKLKSQE
jgi:hypothetical protein